MLAASLWCIWDFVILLFLATRQCQCFPDGRREFLMVVAPLGVARASVSELPLASSTVVPRLRKIHQRQLLTTPHDN